MRSASVESLRAEFGDRIHFIVLYQREAHAGQIQFRDIAQPSTYEQRQELAGRACTDLGLSTTIVIDEMDDVVREKYGSAPNSAFIIDMSGRIVYRNDWSIPEDWRPVLERLLGPSP